MLAQRKNVPLKLVNSKLIKLIKPHHHQVCKVLLQYLYRLDLCCRCSDVYCSLYEIISWGDISMHSHAKYQNGCGVLQVS